jgi:hypothetical protein
MSENQLYLLKISAMCTADDIDGVVPSAEIIVNADFGTDNHNIIEALHNLANQLAETIRGAPLENVRPMTRAEVQQWRDDQAAEDAEHTVRVI